MQRLPALVGDHLDRVPAAMTRQRQVEYGVLVIAVLAFLVLLVFRIGPPPLMLLPWLVIAGVGTRLATSGRSWPDDV